MHCVEARLPRVDVTLKTVIIVDEVILVEQNLAVSIHLLEIKVNASQCILSLSYIITKLFVDSFKFSGTSLKVSHNSVKSLTLCLNLFYGSSISVSIISVGQALAQCSYLAVQCNKFFNGIVSTEDLFIPTSLDTLRSVSCVFCIRTNEFLVEIGNSSFLLCNLLILESVMLNSLIVLFLHAVNLSLEGWDFISDGICFE